MPTEDRYSTHRSRSRLNIVDFREPWKHTSVLIRNESITNEQGEVDEAWGFDLLCDSRSTAGWDYIFAKDLSASSISTALRRTSFY